ncbi:MAG: FapA family protein [Spirochaetia bacterium]|nr:FapA family protein [Spirochaetia bacterium]
MDPLKKVLTHLRDQKIEAATDKVEVVGMSIASCLEQAAHHLNTDIHMLDYEILQRGKKTFFSPKPFRLLVSVLSPDQRYADLEEFSVKLGVGDRLLSGDLDRYAVPKHKDGSLIVRVYRSGVFLTVHPPKGDGNYVTFEAAKIRLEHLGISQYDLSRVESVVHSSDGKAVKIAAYTPKPENDSACRVEISPDEMKATVTITPPKPGGRHLEVTDIVNALRAHGVVVGFLEDDIHDALLEDRYMQPILAAQGQPPKHGRDAYMDYKVKIKKEAVHFDEDVSGRVDFKELNLVENVVVGQILAEKVPASRGTIGRTLMNRLVDARDGKDVPIKQGKGTILSEDGNKLIAEINGQVVYNRDRISVEPVYRVVGDVGPKTGNIMFLGSIVIGGNVLDNYEVKAVGNIEVQGAVQKAKVEAEGDIIVKQGIVGREGALVESSGGSLIAKFVQSAEVNVAGDVHVQDGILHSRVSAGGKIVCNGRRAQIVGGNIRAAKEVRARSIGSQAYTATEITVGTDPKILSQYDELKKQMTEAETAQSKTAKTLATLEARKKADPESFTDEQDKILTQTSEEKDSYDSKINELKEEILKLEEHMNQQAAQGRVHAEKQMHPGVVIKIKEAAQNVSDTYNAVSLSYDNGYIKFGKFEKEEDTSKTVKRR